MKDCYAGDIGDFGKLGLLRALAGEGLSIGVNWYLTPGVDNPGDGGFVRYDRLARCDPELFAALTAVARGERSVAALERPDILTARFFHNPLAFVEKGTLLPKCRRQALRADWHRAALAALAGVDLVFLDPDNGLLAPSAAGTPRENKYVLAEEMADYYRSGASVVYYQHRARRGDGVYFRQNRDLAASALFPGARAMGLKFCPVSQRYYFFLVRPEHGDRIADTLGRFLAGPWGQTAGGRPVWQTEN